MKKSYLYAMCFYDVCFFNILCLLCGYDIGRQSWHGKILQSFCY